MTWNILTLSALDSHISPHSVRDNPIGDRGSSADTQRRLLNETSVRYRWTWSCLQYLPVSSQSAIPCVALLRALHYMRISALSARDKNPIISRQSRYDYSDKIPGRGLIFARTLLEPSHHSQGYLNSSQTRPKHEYEKSNTTSLKYCSLCPVYSRYRRLQQP